MKSLTRLELILATFTLACLFALMMIGAPAFGQIAPKTTIKGFNKVDTQGLIFRGGEPRSKVKELRDLKIQHVMIIKRQNGTEVDQEKEALRDLAIRHSHIPMEWDKADVKKLCFQVVQAVNFLQEQSRAGKRTYFHCTLGQDRTGAVAGLFRMVNQGWSSNRAFREEMCARGYSDGAKGKPVHITREIEKSLTPVFLALSKSMSSGNLNPSACNQVSIPARVPRCSDLAP